MGFALKLPWRLVAAALAVGCLVLGYSVWALLRAQARLSERFGETYSALILAEVRLSHYVDLVDEKNAALAAAAADAGDTLQADALCADLCSLRTSLCDSLTLARRLRKGSVVAESRGVAAAVCSWLKTGRN